MKFLIIGDLHGVRPKIHYKKFDAIISPGDVCSDKGIRPYKNQWAKALKQKKTDKGIFPFLIEKIGKRKLNQITKKSLEVGKSILKYLDQFQQG